MAEVEEVTEIRETNHEPDHTTNVAARVVHYIFGIIIAFIIVRIILLLLGANQGSPFVDIVYNVSGLFVAPFYGVFNNTPAYGSSVLDLSAIVAVVIYGLISWGLGALFTIGNRHRHASA